MFEHLKVDEKLYDYFKDGRTLSLCNLYKDFLTFKFYFITCTSAIAFLRYSQHTFSVNVKKRALSCIRGSADITIHQAEFSKETGSINRPCVHKQKVQRLCKDLFWCKHHDTETHLHMHLFIHFHRLCKIKYYSIYAALLFTFSTDSLNCEMAAD